MTFIELLNHYGNVILHGKGDGISPFDVDKHQLIVGLYVEREHSNNPFLALKVAIDHLTERSDYYIELVKSGIVDEYKALELAKKYLGIEPIDQNAVIDIPKSDDEMLTDVLLGFKPKNIGDYS